MGHVLLTGVDIVEIDRFQSALARHGRRFLDRVFTPSELRHCRGKTESLAVRFAAKEATFKALGRHVGWRAVEVERQDAGKPHMRLHGEAQELAERLGIRLWALSLTHSRLSAVAVVVASD